MLQIRTFCTHLQLFGVKNHHSLSIRGRCVRFPAGSAQPLNLIVKMSSWMTSPAHPCPLYSFSRIAGNQADRVAPRITHSVGISRTFVIFRSSRWDNRVEHAKNRQNATKISFRSDRFIDTSVYLSLYRGCVVTCIAKKRKKIWKTKN